MSHHPAGLPTPHYGSGGRAALLLRRPTGAATASLSVDFVNTVVCPACRVKDALSSLGDFARWTRAHPDLPSLMWTQPGLNRLMVLREDLRLLFEHSIEHRRPPLGPLSQVNACLRLAPVHLELKWRGTRLSFEEVLESRDPEQRWMGIVARSAVELLGGPFRQRLRRCQAPDCLHYLVARTRGQLWCSATGCGNRVRVARHYRRIKQGRPVSRRGRGGRR